MVAPQHDTQYLPNGAGSYVCLKRLSSREEPDHPLLIGYILFHDYSFAYVSGFPFQLHIGLFCKPISVFLITVAQIWYLWQHSCLHFGCQSTD